MGVVINQIKTLERIEYVILFMVYMSGLGCNWIITHRQQATRQNYSNNNGQVLVSQIRV